MELYESLATLSPSIVADLFQTVLRVRVKKHHLYFRFLTILPKHQAIADHLLLTTDLMATLMGMEFGLFTPQAIHAKRKVQMKHFAYYFLPELEQVDQKLFQKHVHWMDPGVIAPLRQNNWERLRAERLQLSAPPHEIAIMEDDLSSLKDIVSQSSSFSFNAMIQSSMFHRMPLLSLAAKYDSFKCFKFLLLNGANPRLPGAGGWRPLHFAIEGGDIEIIQTLIEQDGDLAGALCAAIQTHRPDVAEWLRDVKEMTEDQLNGMTDTETAVTYGNVHELINRKDILVNEELLSFGIQNNHLIVCQYLQTVCPIKSQELYDLARSKGFFEIANLYHDD